MSGRKSGHHAGGIPFFRATWPELSEMLAPHLWVGERTGALLYHFLVWGRKRMDGGERSWELPTPPA